MVEELEEIHKKMEKRKEKKQTGKTKLQRRERRLLRRRRQLGWLEESFSKTSEEGCKKRKREDCEPEEIRKPLWMTWREWNVMDEAEREGLVYGIGDRSLSTRQGLHHHLECSVPSTSSTKTTHSWLLPLSHRYRHQTSHRRYIIHALTPHRERQALREPGRSSSEDGSSFHR